MVMLTAFEPFGVVSDVNPSATVVSQVAHQKDVPWVHIPVTYDGGWRKAVDAARSHNPHTVLVCGFAKDVAGLQLERYARNLCTSTTPDNDGIIREGQPAIAGGVDHYVSALNLDALATTLRSKGHDIAISDDAGGYVCNHTYYMVTSEMPSTRVLFVHMDARENTESAIRALSDLVKAVS